MKKTYIFGHRKPDTDSVCSSIALAYLKNKLGLECEPRVLGTINNETKYALDYFKVDAPKYLNDVKVQVRDIDFKKDIVLNAKVSIAKAFRYMMEQSITALPLINDNKKLNGLITLKEISKELINGNITHLDTSFSNILDTIDGQEILKFDNSITGELLVAAFNSDDFINKVKLHPNHILIVGNRFNIIKKAIESQIKLIIVVGNHKLHDSLIAMAEDNKVNIIYSPLDTYQTSNKIRLANYAKSININEHPITFDINDYRSEIVEEINKCGHTNYPVVNKKGQCLGLLKVTDTSNYEKQDIILVDHNQQSQSVEGIEEANILEVVDHHNLGTIGTSIPISFRAMPVGCTCTIINKLFEEAKVAIPKDIAGLMLSAILSDTMIFKSPTTTELDKETAAKLAQIAQVDIDSYGYEMFKAGSTIKGMTCDEVLNQDLKIYKIDEENMAISQVFTMDFDDIEKDMQTYVNLLNNLANQGNKVAVMFVTDVIKNGSYVIYNDSAKDIIAESFDLENIKQGIYIDNLVSRKKQMVPNIMERLMTRYN